MKVSQIEKDVPIPEDGRVKYHFAELEVGDSFAVHFSDDEKVRVRKNLYTAKWRAQKRLNRKFVARIVGKNELRVWRTK